ncbi:MAG: hypothetical protein KBF94_00715 [Ilumatobacteraceae bacterium]|nr:hypothetical protein [Ilumatobacteraceae bacterium]
MPGALTTFRVIGGARIGLELPAEALAQLIERIGFAAPVATTLPPTLRYRSTTGRDGHHRFERHDPLRDNAVEVIGATIDQLVDDMHLSIALHATDDVFVHAGVVSWNGRAVLLPGRSLAGKSTLVHELVRAGATYLSDEYARITPSGEIAPYPRPLQLRTANGRRLVDPHTIGCVADAPCVPGLVVFTQHRTGGAFEPVVVPPAQAALELYNNTVIAKLEPARAIRAVAHMARGVLSVRSDRGESATTVSLIRSLIDAEVAV